VALNLSPVSSSLTRVSLVGCRASAPITSPTFRQAGTAATATTTPTTTTTPPTPTTTTTTPTTTTVRGGGGGRRRRGVSHAKNRVREGGPKKVPACAAPKH
jgi:hypothetical protein